MNDRPEPTGRCPHRGGRPVAFDNVSFSGGCVVNPRRAG